MFFINTARLFETVTETDIQVRCPKDDDNLFPLTLDLEYFANPKYVRGYLQWAVGVFPSFSILRISI